MGISSAILSAITFGVARAQALADARATDEAMAQWAATVETLTQALTDQIAVNRRLEARVQVFTEQIETKDFQIRTLRSALP